MKVRSPAENNAGSLPDHVLLVVHVSQRTRQASKIQTVLTRFGDIIHTRLGLHDTHGGPGTPDGLIVLELRGAEKDMSRLAQALRNIRGLEVTLVRFSHRPNRSAPLEA
jgi:hypothetical protein